MSPDRLLRAACLGVALTSCAPAHAPRRAAAPGAGHLETAVPDRATGTFEVKLTPQATAGDEPGTTPLARLSIDKQFRGDIQGTSRGEMLSAVTGVKGSAGYVAVERVRGTLRGRTGTFVLQHSGTMTRGAPQLTITVVPDSGTDELAGLAGSMTIDIADGKHSYTFVYTLAAP